MHWISSIWIKMSNLARHIQCRLFYINLPKASPVKVSSVLLDVDFGLASLLLEDAGDDRCFVVSTAGVTSEDVTVSSIPSHVGWLLDKVGVSAAVVDCSVVLGAA